mgnify:CR=1 FL=1
MRKDNILCIVDLENYLDSYDIEFQSIGNEIKAYLADNEIYIIIGDHIEIHDYDNNIYKLKTIEEAIRTISTLIS